MSWYLFLPFPVLADAVYTATAKMRVHTFCCDDDAVYSI